MSKILYVGNLSPGTTAEEIRKLLEPYGEVDSVDFVTDRYSGEHGGFGFVKMADRGAGEVIAAVDMTEVNGRAIRVHEVIPRKTSGSQRSYR